jgi:hypothetical protein
MDPNQPLQLASVVSCEDCFAKFALPADQLPKGVTAYKMAEQLTQHLRTQRGFALSTAGYHTNGPGFWVSVAYYDCGLFLIKGDRSQSLGSDLDLLLLAFQHRVLQPLDPQMTDAKHYNVSTAYVNFSAFVAPIPNKAALLIAPQLSQQNKPGWQRVTVAEFLPRTTPTPPTTQITASIVRQPPVPTPPAAAPTAPAALKPGEVCPKCKAKVCQRQLLHGTYVGCLC